MIDSMNSSGQNKHSFHFYVSELVFVAFFVLSAVLLATSSGGFVLNFERIGFSVVSSLQKGVSAVSTGVKDSVNAIQELSRIKKENAILVEKLKNYEYFQRNNTEINKENERLREQLGFSTKIEQKNYPAQIIGRMRLASRMPNLPNRIRTRWVLDLMDSECPWRSTFSSIETDK